jgi:uncharacterized membrane protein
MDLLPQHSWHPMVIHFPLVALLLAVTLDAYEAWSRSSRWRETGTLLWWVGLLGAGAAVATGLIAYNRVDHSELAHAQMTLHRNLALAVVGLLLGTALWRWRQPSSRGPALTGVLAAVGLLWVGYLGGDLVFRHAVGVPTEVVEQVIRERGGHMHEGGEPMPSVVDGDSTVRSGQHAR